MWKLLKKQKLFPLCTRWTISFPHLSRHSWFLTHINVTKEALFELPTKTDIQSRANFGHSFSYVFLMNCLIRQSVIRVVGHFLPRRGRRHVVLHYRLEVPHGYREHLPQLWVHLSSLPTNASQFW